MDLYVQAIFLAFSILSINSIQFNSTNLQMRFYVTLCQSSCICGTLSHPLKPALSNTTWFVPFFNKSKSSTGSQNVFLGVWFIKTSSIVAFRFPVQLFYCIGQRVDRLPFVSLGLNI